MRSGTRRHAQEPASQAAVMNALKELKKQATQWLPVDLVFKFLTIGQLWCKRPPPPFRTAATASAAWTALARVAE